MQEIASCSKDLPYKGLGYKVADFRNYFVLAHSFGSGNPNYLQLIKKDNAHNVLRDGSVWIGANEETELLLYVENARPGPKDKIILYDVKDNRKDFFSFPKDIFFGRGCYQQNKG